MSEATKAAVEDAIRAHVNDESGEPMVITDWYVVLAAASLDADETHYWHMSSDAPWHVLTGLVHRAWMRMKSWTDIGED